MSKLTTKTKELTDLARKYYYCCNIRRCIRDDRIVCSKEIIHYLLKNKIIAKRWWELTDREREIFADYIIRNWLFYYIPYKREGQRECKGGTGDWKRAVCLHNALIRYLRFGKGEKHYDQISSCYWSRDGKEEYCYWEESYDLPVFPVSVVTMGPGYGHAICAIQIKKNKKDFNSWRFFQYSNANIKIGDWQMPCKYTYQGEEKAIYVCINEPILLSCGGYSSNRIVKWNIDLVTCKPILAE